jgi:hypothetical protein
MLEPRPLYDCIDQIGESRMVKFGDGVEKLRLTLFIREGSSVSVPQVPDEYSDKNISNGCIIIEYIDGYIWDSCDEMQR